jgi:hypothetical protein
MAPRVRRNKSLSEGFDPAVAESARRDAEERRAAEEKAFAAKLAKRPPPNPVERAAIEKAIKRTKARAPRIAINIEDRGTAGRALYPDHSDEEGHQYQLAEGDGIKRLDVLGNLTNKFMRTYTMQVEALVRKRRQRGASTGTAARTGTLGFNSRIKILEQHDEPLMEVVGVCVAEFRADLRMEFRKELEVATGELGVELRELIAELRTEFARLTELGRRLASLATETAGLHLRGAYQSDQDYDRW